MSRREGAGALGARPLPVRADSASVRPVKERMHRLLDSPAMTAPTTGAAASVLAIAAVTGAIFLFKGFVPVLSLGVLYVFAVLPVAVEWGLAFSLPVAVGSMLAFNFFFLPPVHTLTLTESENWFALAV
jgi:K+-sensing histidine kinase KdpD